MRLGLPCLLLISALAACAPTIGPVSDRLPVRGAGCLDSHDRELAAHYSRGQRGSGRPLTRCTLRFRRMGTASPTSLAVHGSLAAVAYSDSTALVIVDLAAEQPRLPVITLDANKFDNPVASLAFSGDGTVFAALPVHSEVISYVPGAAGVGT